MSVIRKKIDNNYTKISNQMILDMRVSNGAYRMLNYLWSLPDNWTVNNSDIKLKLNIGDNATIARYWKQLIDAGWIVRLQVKNEKLQFVGYDYELIPDMQIITNAELDNIRIGGNTQLGNTPHLNNTNLLNKTNINKKINKKEQPSNDKKIRIFT